MCFYIFLRIKPSSFLISYLAFAVVLFSLYLHKAIILQFLREIYKQKS